MNRLQILTGDCRDILPRLPAQSVQTCITSPPYWGLRDYGTAQWEGGEAGCDHKRFNGYPSGLQGSKESTYNGKFEKLVCGKCGARRIDLQFGLEATSEEYIAKMVAVFRAVWRVLKPDATCWINLGDSYATSNPAGRRDSGNGTSAKFGDHEIAGSFGESTRRNVGLKPKDLCMMPARLAMALQAAGWYLRSEIVWHKPNPMPESVTDRPTKAHEMIYLLAKQERYFYDAEAIREPDLGTDHARNVVEAIDSSNGFLSPHSKIRTANGRNGTGRNKRTVWTIATQPYAEAHFATFPEEIPKLCILASTKVGDTVLDPFAGSGTVGQVALELGRRALLIELNPAYIELAEDRTFVTPGFL
jgi:DNA modification methylase